MGATTPKEFSKEKIIQEISDVINESAGITSYEIKRTVVVDELVMIKVELEMYYDSKGKKVIV